MDEVSVYEERIEAILAEYQDDAEGGHVSEDHLLEEFVRAKAEQGDWQAVRLLRLFDNDLEYSKWFA